MAKKQIGVIRGGTGEHYASSLKRGGEIISHIFENLQDKYRVVDILIDKKGVWHLGGVPIVPADLMSKVDLVWNISDSSLSATLDSLSIPNISHNSFSSAFVNSKEMLREHIKQVGISMPKSIVLPVYQKDFDGPRERYSIKKAKEIHEKFSAPWIVKSFTLDSNMAVHLAKTFNELVAGIEDGVKHGKSILIEEFITGKVASMHSVSHFRGKETYVFPPVSVFGNISSLEKEELTNLARNLHNHLGAKYYLKSDFVLNKNGRVYFLDFDLMPNLKSHSHFSQACESVGAKMYHVVEHIIENA
ncbi:MAG: hypothetical protein NTZ87_03065 [Candidatus Nomurabacteria bacterium]|nr:hypothetical protein [Candidatus Nomurabacteria bacterium]